MLESKQVIRIALGQVTAKGVFVRLRTGDGLAGWGEASPYAPITGETQASCLAIGKQLAQVVRGRDVFDLARLVADMDAVTAGNPSIKAAIEMALWDLCGKLTPQPVCHLLGRYRDSFETDRTVYLDTFTEHKLDPVIGGMQVKDGLVTLPETPGLGLDVDADFLKALKPA